MNRKERREIAKQIAKLEQDENENNILENMKEMENLVKGCSMEDLFKIDELIMKKYLTN